MILIPVVKNEYSVAVYASGVCVKQITPTVAPVKRQHIQIMRIGQDIRHSWPILLVFSYTAPALGR